MKGLMVALQYHHRAAEGRADKVRRDCAAPARGCSSRALSRLRLFSVCSGSGTLGVGAQGLKELLIATLACRLNHAPVALPPNGWDDVEHSNSRACACVLSFSKDSDALVYTGGSALRDDVKGTGYFVFSPAHLPNGAGSSLFVRSRAYPANISPDRSAGRTAVIVRIGP